jgi:DNA end-binding protein Ku
LVVPRSIWNGTITFGMVNVPIKLYPATESKTVHFHEVHLKDGSQIEHRRMCPKEDKEVAFKDIVKGYELSDGKYVVLDKDEIKAAAGDRGKVIHLREFVQAEETTRCSTRRRNTSARARTRMPTGCCSRL